MDRGKENSKSLIMLTSAGYGESRPRRKRAKKRTLSRSSASKNASIQERADFAQHRKRADRHTIATVCGLTDDLTTSSSTSGASGKTAGDWQAHRPLKDAMTAISRSRLTQQVGKVGIYNQAKLSQPAHRDSQSSASSQTGSQTSGADHRRRDLHCEASSVVLSSANLHLHNQLLREEEQQQRTQWQTSKPATAATPPSPKPAQPCGSDTRSQQCQVKLPTTTRSLMEGSNGFRAAQDDIDNICARLSSSVKPDNDFNLSYRDQLMTELKKLAVDCSTASFLPLCSSTPAPQNMGAGSAHTDHTLPGPTQHPLSADTAMSLGSTPIRGSLSNLAAGLPLPGAAESSECSPPLASPSLAVQQAIAQHYPLKVHPQKTNSSASSSGYATATNALSMFADGVASKVEDNSSCLLTSTGSVPGSHGVGGSMAAACPTCIATASGHPTNGTAITAAATAMASSMPAPSFASDVASSQHGSVGRGPRHGHSMDSIWTWQDPGAPPSSSSATSSLYSRQQRATKGPWCSQSLSGSPHSGPVTAMQVSHHIPTMNGCVSTSTYTTGNSAMPSPADLAHRHSVLELLPPQLHHKRRAPGHSRSLPPSSADFPALTSWHSDPRGARHPPRALYSSASDNAYVTADDSVPDFLDVLDRDQMGIAGPDTLDQVMLHPGPTSGRGSFGPGGMGHDILDHVPFADPDALWGDIPAHHHHSRISTEILPLVKPGSSPSPPDFKLFPQKMY